MPFSTKIVFLLVEEVGCPNLELTIVGKRFVKSAGDSARCQQGRRKRRPRDSGCSVNLLQLHGGVKVS